MTLTEIADELEGIASGESCSASCPHRLSGTTEACDASVCAKGVLFDAAWALRDMADGYEHVTLETPCSSR